MPAESGLQDRLEPARVRSRLSSPVNFATPVSPWESAVSIRHRRSRAARFLGIACEWKPWHSMTASSSGQWQLADRLVDWQRQHAKLPTCSTASDLTA